jgi:voltage-gated potassium channel Kch
LLLPHSQALSGGTVRDNFLFLLIGVASGETALSVATLRLFEAVVVLVKDAV